MATGWIAFHFSLWMKQKRSWTFSQGSEHSEQTLKKKIKNKTMYIPRTGKQCPFSGILTSKKRVSGAIQSLEGGIKFLPSKTQISFICLAS